ncbi:MAG: hypothetical protein ACJAW1_003778 [Glaciecola sp.]|jgi:hypothetical protein
MNRINYLFFVIVLSFINSSLTLANDIPELKLAQLQSIGEKIYQNETGSNPEHLIAWNNGEAFASLGLGHFIWFPKDIDSPFTETFPSLLQYLQAQNVAIPDWLQQNQYCPWQNKQDFTDAKKSKQMQELRILLASTFEHQVAFIHQRMRRSLPLMLAEVDNAKTKSLVKSRFQALTATELGMYSLIDYVNFKGEGISDTEKYNNQGWGLLQVLLNMQIDTKNQHLAFTQACDTMLTRRVKNSPQKQVEQNWLAGWRKRCGTYNNVN